MAGFCTRELGYAAILMIGSITFGFTIAYPSPALVEIQSEHNISTISATLYNAIPAITAIAGPFISEPIVRKLGYRWSVFIVSVVGAILWAALLFLTNVNIWWGVFGRAMIGFVLGSTSSIAPLYINEIAPRRWLGIYGSVNQFGITFGVMFCFLISTWIHWTYLCIVCAILFTLLLCLVWLVPDRRATVGESQRESLCQKKYMSKLFVGIATMFFQQFCGVNAIVTNLDALFKGAGLDIPTGIATAIASSAQVIAALIGSVMIQALGRRLVWMISIAGSTAALVFYALCLRFKDWPGLLSIVAVFLFLLFFGCGVGPIPWLIIPQMFPLSVRSIAMSIDTSISWVFVFTIIIIFPYLSGALGEFGCMIAFAVISAIGFVFGFFMITNESSTEPTYENMDEFTEDTSTKDE